MEAQGLFDANPANPSSPDYRGPQQYPKMFYHPEGGQRLIQRAEILSTPMGPQKVGEQFELISRVANDPDEEAALRDAGWHDHPARAIHASGAEMPPMISSSRERELSDEIERLQLQLAAAKNSKSAVVPKDENELAAVAPKGPKVV
jgi:hypothetical protein